MDSEKLSLQRQTSNFVGRVAPLNYKRRSRSPEYKNYSYTKINNVPLRISVKDGCCEREANL